MANESETRRLDAEMREGERVTPLELFFDLVFVLAITQCTALMAHDPTWSGLAQGLLVLGMLWWAWVGYAWLTSVVDPEEGAVRLVMFGAMAALLIVSLCVPEAFGDLALVFALAYGARADRPHRPLHARQPRGRRRCATRCWGSRVSTAIAVALLVDRLALRRRRPGGALGCSRWSSTWAAPTCSARRGGSWSPATSPSATA